MLLYPLLIRRDNSKDYSIIRLGCSTATVVSTTLAGAEACRLFQQRLSLGEVSSRLALKFGRAVDVTRLLAALQKARMIRAIDGRQLEMERPSLARQLHQHAQWMSIRLRSHAVRSIIRGLPVGMSYSILSKIRPKWSGEKQRRVLLQAERNMGAVFKASLPPARIHTLARQFVAEQVRRDIDLEYLSALPEFEVGQWLRQCTAIDGLEHVDRAVAAGNGVILSSFHFSSAHLIVLMLWLRGYSFIGAGGITRNNRDRPLPFDNEELARQLGNCGQVTWFTSFALQHSLQICRTLNRGGIALVFPDGFFSRPKGDVADYFGNTASKYRRAQAGVPFLGRMAEANTGVPWIFQQSRAPLLPVKLVRVSNHQFRLLIGPPLMMDRSAPLPQITAELYRVLEREIALDPAAWAYWRRINEFTSESSSGGKPDEPIVEAMPVVTATQNQIGKEVQIKWKTH